MATLFRWTLALLSVLAIVFAVLLVADDARAQPLPCGPVDQALTQLADEFAEQLIGEGDGPNGVRVLLFAHPEGDTWTVVGVIPGGQACFIASGTDWDVHAFTPAGSET